MQTDTVRVTCRDRECQAQYDQRLPEETRWSQALHDASKPIVCGVCGTRSIIVTDAQEGTVTQ